MRLLLSTALLFHSAPLLADESTGTEREEVTLNLRSKFAFVDRTQFVDRGTVEYRVPDQLDDGIPVADARQLGADLEGILELLNKIERQNQAFKIGKGTPNRKSNPGQPAVRGCVDSVLIAHRGKLVLEEYFADARRDKRHYQMSITKSIQSYAIGKAIELGAIGSENDLILDYLPQVDPERLPAGVDTLRLHDLLTMNSGLRVSAPKKTVKITRENYVPLLLENTTPISADKEYKYDGTNNDILSHILFNTTGKTLGEFAGEHLFGPLGITDFSFGPSICGLDKAAAGMELRSRDMLKIGLLTAANGSWMGERVLNADWIEKATAVHVNQHQPHQYGYFWWSHEIEVDGQTYRVRSCRGAGGQFILVQPDLELVAVFTSYYSGNEPLQWIETILAPAFAGVE